MIAIRTAPTRFSGRLLSPALTLRLLERGLGPLGHMRSNPGLRDLLERLDEPGGKACRVGLFQEPLGHRYGGRGGLVLRPPSPTGRARSASSPRVNSRCPGPRATAAVPRSSGRAVRPAGRSPDAGRPGDWHDLPSPSRRAGPASCGSDCRSCVPRRAVPARRRRFSMQRGRGSRPHALHRWSHRPRPAPSSRHSLRRSSRGYATRRPSGPAGPASAAR